MKFAIFGNIHHPEDSASYLELFKILQEKKAEIYLCKKFYRGILEKLPADITIQGLIEDKLFEADMVISVGGDGTFLHAARQVGDKGIPILGINMGRLGFLADVSLHEMRNTFDDIFAGKYKTEERSVLQITSKGKPIKGYPYALNEIAVLKRDSSSMITIHTYVNGEPLTTYQGDGLIFATPTGSTAYSLSVGGPIIVPQSKAIAITPVAPHSLNMRPIIAQDDWTFSFDVESRSHNFLIAIDGRSESFCEHTPLTIRKANYSILVVKRCNHSFFDTLRSKMMWGIDVRKQH